MKRCPCCGYLTIDATDELEQIRCHNTAKKNYKLFGATEERFINMVRPPYENNI